MADGGKPESKISRRGFFQIGGALIGAGLGALKAPGAVSALESQRILMERENSFETADAVYIPFYENHNNRQSDGAIVNSKPDYLFGESAGPANQFLEVPAEKILLSEGTIAWSPLLPITAGTVRIFSDDLLKNLADQNAMISVEGADLPEKVRLGGELANLGTDLVGISPFGAKLGHMLGEYLVYKKVPDTKDWQVLTAAILLNSLTLHDEAMDIAGMGIYAVDENLPGVKEMRKVADRFTSFISMMHPEQTVVFLRNIFMSLKLQTIAEQNPKNTNDKPVIAFRIGAGHSAVTDLVQFGKKFNLLLLNIYPDSVLKAVIDHNISGELPMEEKIDQFSKTILMDVDWVMKGGTTKILITDNDLKEYLSDRLIPKGAVGGRDNPAPTK
jgi:hypothetical protein